MKPLLVITTVAFASFTLTAPTACSPGDDPFPDTEQTGPDGNKPENPGNDSPDNPDSDREDDNDDNPMNTNLTITVGETTFAATLEDNAAGRAFAALLPMTVEMKELNGNEKYYYLNGSLPPDASRPGTIRTGDLMLYGSDCVVLFYETFSSSYSYTRLGRIDDPSGFAAAVGPGSITVTFGQ